MCNEILDKRKEFILSFDHNPIEGVAKS